MTTVTIQKNHNKIKLSAHDHAYGSNEVCNGISTLFYSMEAWILNNPERVQKHESEFKPGEAYIEFLSQDYGIYEILKFVIIGLVEMEHSYGKRFISVNVSDDIKNLVGVSF